MTGTLSHPTLPDQPTCKCDSPRIRAPRYFLSSFSFRLVVSCRFVVRCVRLLRLLHLSLSTKLELLLSGLHKARAQARAHALTKPQQRQRAGHSRSARSARFHHWFHKHNFAFNIIIYHLMPKTRNITSKLGAHASSNISANSKPRPRSVATRRRRTSKIANHE